MKNSQTKYENIFNFPHDWQFNACLNWSDAPLELYTIGYKEAADNLIDKVFSERYMQNALVYPICFLYRQYIELRLKEIIRSGRILLDEGTGFPQHHRINKLWETAKEIIKKVFSDEKEHPDLSLIEHVISEYSKIDPDSFSFRYPFDKSGKNILEGINYINLRHLSEYIDKFGEAIDNISFVISVSLDHKNEFSDF